MKNDPTPCGGRSSGQVGQIREATEQVLERTGMQIRNPTIHQQEQEPVGQPVAETQKVSRPDHTVRIARWQLLYVAAKLCFHENRDQVYYSIHEQRAEGIINFME